MSEDYRVYTYTIPRGQVRRIDAVGSYISVLEATSETLAVNIDDSGFQQIEQGLTVELEAGRKFQSVQIKNTGRAAVTVTVAVGIGRLRDARFSFVGGTVPTEERVPAHGELTSITVAANGTREKGASPKNIEYIVSNPPWSIGPSKVGVYERGGRGCYVNPGQTVYIPGTANLIAVNPWPEEIVLFVTIPRRA